VTTLLYTQNPIYNSRVKVSMEEQLALGETEVMGAWRILYNDEICDLHVTQHCYIYLGM